MTDQVVWLNEVAGDSVPLVGGKNASLGEMATSLHQAGVSVPKGFATTSDAFRETLAMRGTKRAISALMEGLDPDDVVSLATTGKQIRRLVEEIELPETLVSEIRVAYAELEQQLGSPLAVAVRSSATAEDLPEASFAGQQETFLNVVGIDEVLKMVVQVYASLFTDRAIAYRVHHGFDWSQVAMSVGVQQMVRSDLGASGVAFSIDTESGFPDVVFITSTYGLGETLVQGIVNPDEFYVYKPAIREERPAIISKRLGDKDVMMVYSEEGDRVRVVEVAIEQRRAFSLTDDHLAELARLAVVIEDHYGRPMDIEWALDGVSDKLYVVQARPETVQSRATGNVMERYSLTDRGPVLTEGRSVGQRIGSGPVKVLTDPSAMHHVEAGDVLVADMTDPDWEPVMARASAIVTNRGGRTCHAAIIARELGIPAVVGTVDATAVLTDSQLVTVSCAEGDTGFVYEGSIDYDVARLELAEMPELEVDIMMNVASPERAFAFANLPNRGVGLARVEFIINNTIGLHPRAVLDYPDVAPEVAEQIEARSTGYPDARTFFVEKLKEGIATIAAAFSPKQVIVRLSDFKSNEYAGLPGGMVYEPAEENPMIGFRGASRYRSARFAPALEMECKAIRLVREQLGFSNVSVMVPFVRTVAEAEEVVAILAEHGIERGESGLKLIMMCEVPANAILARQFLQHFDGFSIGSNDLTQFTLALDRDSALVAPMFDETNPAVKHLIHLAITECKAQGKYVGICGQGPSDHPEFAKWLASERIDSISLNPDSVVATWLHLAGASSPDA